MVHVLQFIFTLKPSPKGLLLIFLCLLTNLTAFGQGTSIKGVLKDYEGKPVPFASVAIAGTTNGGTCNEAGIFEIKSEKALFIEFRAIGYKTKNIELTVGPFHEVIIESQNYLMKELVVRPGKRDPAYAIIREAQKKRKEHLREVKSYKSRVYVKGLQRITKNPGKIMGVKVDLGDSYDPKTGIIYLSESVSELSYLYPSKFKEKMTKSKVSGSNKAFSYNQASDFIISFYDNNIKLNFLRNRAFASPIGEDAFLNYTFKLLGSYIENGEEINEISIKPRFPGSSCFTGKINIVENSWRIHSINVYVSKEAQIEFVDTLSIKQIHKPLEDGRWFPMNTSFRFAFGAFGLEGNGYYHCNHSNLIVNPAIKKKELKGAVLEILPTAQVSDSSEWELLRPIPLTFEEKNDYVKKDSVIAIKESKTHLDSIDHQKNKFKAKDLLVGYTIQNTFEKKLFNISPIWTALAFNPVQGFNSSVTIRYITKNNEANEQSLSMNTGYGLGNKTFFGNLSFSKKTNPRNPGKIDLSLGSAFEQFNPQNPLPIWVNTLYCLINSNNYFLLYKNYFFKLKWEKDVLDLFIVRQEIAWQNRMRTSNSKNQNPFNKDTYYLENTPISGALMDSSLLANHQVLQWKGSILWQPGKKFILTPEGKETERTGNFSFRINYTLNENITTKLGQNTNLCLETFLFFRTSLFRNIRWFATANSGTFLFNQPFAFQDFKHFNGNQTIWANSGINDFQLIDYYRFSTPQSYFQFHQNINAGGSLLNKIPLIRKLHLQEWIGTSILLTKKNAPYYESIFGVRRLNLQLNWAWAPIEKTNRIVFGINF
jgi:hypothetical protein